MLKAVAYCEELAQWRLPHSFSSSLSSKCTLTVLLITPVLIRGHADGYGAISFIPQRLPPPCNWTHLTCPFTWWVCFQLHGTSWTHTHTHSFPKPGHRPVVWPMFEHHFDTIGTCKITQCRKMGSQDKKSSSVSSSPASKEKMSHRSGQIHALARPALTWGCLRLPWPQRPPLLCLRVRGVHGY